MGDIPASISTTAEVSESFLGSESFSGQLETAGDHDWLRFTMVPNQTIHFYLSFLNTDSVIEGDSTLTLRDETGAEIAANDDGGVGRNSFLSFTAPNDGVHHTYFIDVGEFGDNHTGSYCLFTNFFSALDPVHKLTDANDFYTSVDSETVLGGKGADTINGNAATILGEQGNDIITCNGHAFRVSGGLGDDTIYDTGSGAARVFGDAGNDVLISQTDGVSSVFDGGLGNDFLYGGDGGDNLTGGAGKDFITGGGGDDEFVYNSIDDSRGANRDVIFDFSETDGDRFNLQNIDAKKGGSDNAFKFIGKQAFHHKAGELHYVKHDLAGTAHDTTSIQGDVNGDGKADFEIQLIGLHTLTADDFFL
jgi:Ca2+-binding RTX toxin-like protein